MSVQFDCHYCVVARFLCDFNFVLHTLLMCSFICPVAGSRELRFFVNNIRAASHWAIRSAILFWGYFVFLLWPVLCEEKSGGNESLVSRRW